MNVAPIVQARLTGVLYLIIMVAALFSEIAVRGALIVSGDAAETARNILAAEPLFRLGGVLDVLTYVADVAVAALLFLLIKPAGAYLASIAAAFRLAYSAMAGVLCFYSFSALGILNGDGLEAFTTAQREAMALSQLELRETGFVAALIFFGVHIVLLGASLIKSRCFPRWIGMLLIWAGSCYIINSVVILQLPALSLGPWLLLPGFVGEGALTFWLLIVGLNEREWNKEYSV